MSEWTTFEKALSSLLTAPARLARLDLRPDNLCTDTRLIQPGDWFLALVGPNFNGHTFLREAFDKGAHGCIVRQQDAHQIPRQLLEKALLVHDTTAALHALAKAHRASLKKLKVACITGSVGKTTTREMIAAIFAVNGQTLATAKNENNEIGLPKTLLQLDKNHRRAVLELGARNIGDIALLTETAQPDVAVCLNAGTAHIGVFGSYENLRKTKLEIITTAPQQCVGVVLRDQEDLFEHCQASQRALLTFGYHPESDIRILEQNDRGILLSSPGGNQIKIQSQFAQHAAFPINAAAAAATALAAGVSQDAIVEGLANYLPPSGRYQVINLNHDRVLIDDSYNASKESVSAGIMSVVQNYQKRGKTIILGDILESGASWRETHSAIGSLVTAADNIKRLILVGEKAKFIGIQAAKSGLNSEVIQYYDDVDELLAKVDTLGDLEGVCYIKGSNRVGLWKFVPVLKKLYGDDRAVSPF